MNSLFTYSLYGIAGVLLVLSCIKSRKKTLIALKKAWKMFIAVMPQFLAILLLVGILLKLLGADAIKHIMGDESGFGGIAVSALAGSVALIPVLIAFPIAAELIKNGAGITQIAVFISTLTTVGLATLPMETRFLGKKAALLRNALAFLISFATAYIMGAILP